MANLHLVFVSSLNVVQSESPQRSQLRLRLSLITTFKYNTNPSEISAMLFPYKPLAKRAPNGQHARSKNIVAKNNEEQSAYQAYCHGVAVDGTDLVTNGLRGIARQ